jgi:hypothetical protein
MKVFRFVERIQTTVSQYYEVTAETEELALLKAQDGQGFQESFTEDTGPGEFELYDFDEVPEK